MYMDERSNLLFKELLKNPIITNKELQEKFQFSRRQIDYSFKKINSWLDEQGKPQIQKKNGQYRIDRKVFKLFEYVQQEEQVDFYIPSERERAFLIILFILTREEELSLNHLMSELDVSKNTVLQDLKSVQKILIPFKLKVNYSRVDGYFLKGEEWDKRSAMLDAIQHIIRSYAGEQFLRKYMKISDQKIQYIHEQIIRIEEHLNLTFVDDDLLVLPYSLEGIFKRIGQGKQIHTDFFIDYSDLSDTREYEAVQILIEGEADIAKEERLYLTLQLLTSNVFQKGNLSGEELPKLKNALRECLMEFEKKAVIQLVDKEILLGKMFAHFKPAYYRIKYNLTTDYRPLEKISREFKILHYFVNESIDPLRNYLKCDVPVNESMFIAFFIGGHIIDKTEKLHVNSNLKAVVVCPNGLSISKLMEKNLYTIFPEIDFYPAMSIRAFNDLEYDYDIVFSATSIETEKHLFIVNQMMDQEEKIELRRRVMSAVYMIDEKNASVDKLMELIEEFAFVNDRENLIDSLQSLINSTYEKNHKKNPTESNIQLYELLSMNRIQRVEKVADWHEAIQLASKPLLDNGDITQAYVEAMKDQYPVVAEHIVLQRKIAIPHAETEKGVLGLGMSLLYIEKGLPNVDESLLHFIVVIAAVDKSSHFKSLLQLMGLAGDSSALSKLANSEAEAEMYDELVRFTTEMGRKEKLEKQTI